MAQYPIDLRIQIIGVTAAIDGFTKAVNELRRAFVGFMPLSGWAGIVTQYRNDGVKWAIQRQRGWHFDFWTPAWHRGRGPYLSLGLGWIAVYRGY